MFCAAKDFRDFQILLRATPWPLWFKGVAFPLRPSRPLREGYLVAAYAALLSSSIDCLLLERGEKTKGDALRKHRLSRVQLQH
jgi:hypothetical protein